jgi:hypothetical protein
LKDKCQEIANTLETQKKKAETIWDNHYELLIQKEELKTLLRATHDESYQYLINRKLDPEAKSMGQKLQRLIARVGCGINQLEQHLNMLFEQRRHQRKIGIGLGQHKFVPVLEQLYAAIRNQSRVISQQTETLKVLTSKWESLQRKASAHGYFFPSAILESRSSASPNTPSRRKSLIMRNRSPLSYTSQALLAQPYKDLTEQYFDCHLNYQSLDKKLQQAKQQTLKGLIPTERLKVNSRVINSLNMNMTVAPLAASSSPAKSSPVPETTRTDTPSTSKKISVDEQRQLATVPLTAPTPNTATLTTLQSQPQFEHATQSQSAITSQLPNQISKPQFVTVCHCVVFIDMSQKYTTMTLVLL